MGVPEIKRALRIRIPRFFHLHSSFSPHSVRYETPSIRPFPVCYSFRGWNQVRGVLDLHSGGIQYSTHAKPA